MPTKTSLPNTIRISAAELDPTGERRPAWEALALLNFPEGFVRANGTELLLWEEDIERLLEIDGGTGFLRLADDGILYLNLRRTSHPIGRLAPTTSATGA